MLLTKAFFISATLVASTSCFLTGTYYIYGEIGQYSEIPHSLAVDIIQDAFDVWTCYIGIKFRRVTDPKQATIFVVFGEKMHPAFKKGGVQTQCHNYDFSNEVESGFGIAAHSTLLHDKENPANIHLHASQVWTYGVKAIGSRSLFEVVVHEIGHVFGIGHNDVKGEPTAVMTTGHRNYVPPDHFDLTKADINALKNTAFGKLLKKKNLLKEHCSDKPSQRKMADRLHWKIPCRDIPTGHGFCRKAAPLGYCENEYEESRKTCRLSCTFCVCKDAVPTCRAENCLLRHYLNYNIGYCRKTCGLCPVFVRPWIKFENTHFAKRRCIDEMDSKRCEKAKKEGICKEYRMVNIMRNFCRKTCGFCH